MRLKSNPSENSKRKLVLGCGGGLILAVLALATAVLIRMGPSPACLFPSTGVPATGESVRSLEAGGRQRCYLLYVPRSIRSGKPAPLVISLHGVGLQPQGLADMTGWNQIAEREGLILVYPQGTGYPLRWNSSTAHSQQAADDVRFIVELVEEILDALPVDPDRMYVNGLSNGGGMAYRLVCERPDLFAAIGGVAGFYASPPGGCNPGKSVPVIAFHGTADPLVLYDGGEIPDSFLTNMIGFRPQGPGLVYPPVESWALAWAARNDCRMSPEGQRLTEEVQVLRYAACSQNAEVVLYTIEGGGHAWPSQSRPGLSLTTKDIDATETIWAFFESYPIERQAAAR